MTMQTFRKRALAVINSAPTTIPDSIRVSDNGKTGLSINVSITDTCQPTKECMDYCYATRGPMAWPNSLKLQHANVLRFNYLEIASQETVDAECANIAKIVDKAKMNWLRWNGVGDLIPGSVRVINRLAVLRPDITQWVVTRKVVEASKLLDLKSIKVLFSLDASTSESIKSSAIALKSSFKKAKFRFSWTRRDETNAPKIVNIIFNEHIGTKRGEWSEDKRTCHATLPGGEHNNACNDCRRCFA